MARQSQRRRGEAPRKSHRTSDGIPPRKTVLWQSCSGSLQPGTENLPAKAGQSLDRYPRSRSDHSSSWALWAIPTYRSSPERPRIASSILARLTLLSAGLPAYSTSLYSPAAAAFGTSSLSPALIASQRFSRQRFKLLQARQLLQIAQPKPHQKLLRRLVQDWPPDHFFPPRG